MRLGVRSGDADTRRQALSAENRGDVDPGVLDRPNVLGDGEARASPHGPSQTRSSLIRILAVPRVPFSLLMPRPRFTSRFNPPRKVRSVTNNTVALQVEPTPAEAGCPQHSARSASVFEHITVLKMLERAVATITASRRLTVGRWQQVRANATSSHQMTPGTPAMARGQSAPKSRIAPKLFPNAQRFPWPPRQQVRPPGRGWVRPARVGAVTIKPSAGVAIEADPSRAPKASSAEPYVTQAVPSRSSSVAPGCHCSNALASLAFDWWLAWRSGSPKQPSQVEGAVFRQDAGDRLNGGPW